MQEIKDLAKIQTWLLLTLLIQPVKPADESDEYNSMFRKELIIFSSSYNITRLLVPAEGVNYVHSDVTIPTIFFTVSDPKLLGGSSIYVLQGLTAYEVLEGGRDTTSDYGPDRTIYLGANNGVFKYETGSLSARKFGPFDDDIIQLQKATNSDAIYFLNSRNKIFKLEKDGTVKTRVQRVVCAHEFVLDRYNNLYYIACENGLPQIIKPDGSVQLYLDSMVEDFKEVKLLRPSFLMGDCVPFFADGYLYVLYANGSSFKKDLYVKEKPSAFSIDAALYLVAALDGKIYEFNVVEILLKSMFGVTYQWPSDITKIVMSII